MVETCLAGDHLTPIASQIANYVGFSSYLKTDIYLRVHTTVFITDRFIFDIIIFMEYWVIPSKFRDDLKIYSYNDFTVLVHA